MPGNIAKEKIRAGYAWHLRPPFADLFVATHWWKGTPAAKLDSVAALYELARRHPRIGELRRKFQNRFWHGRERGRPLTGSAKEKLIDTAFDDLGHEPAAIHCLCLIGLAAWPQLDWRNQEYWEASAGKLKGVDCRDSLMQCSSLAGRAFSDLLIERLVTFKAPKGSMRFHVEGARGDSSTKNVAPEDEAALRIAQKKLVASLKEKPIRAKEFETKIAKRAVAAYRDGNLLFSVAPDLANERASKLLSDAYRGEQKQFGLGAQRARWVDWLPLVESFEDSERNHGGAKARVFTSYRRLLDGIEFERRKTFL